MPRWDQKERYRVLARLRLGDVADRFPMLEVACDRCERRGRVNLVRLVKEHGRGLSMLRVPWIVMAGKNCERMLMGKDEDDPCGVHFPELSQE
jgi:hypothetical protein